MQSRPDLVGMVDGVLGFMRSDALKNPGPHAMHHARISINALELIKRELQLGPAADQEEHARLRALLGTDGSLEDLNRLLCARIENGEIAQPRVDKITRIATALGLDPITVLSDATGTEPLTIAGFLQRRYPELPAEAAADIERYAEAVLADHHINPHHRKEVP